MFIIKQGIGYKIVGNDAFKIDYDANGNIITTDEKIKVEKTDIKYTYEEMYRKLNIKYFATLKKLTPKKPSFKDKETKKLNEEDKKKN